MDDFSQAFDPRTYLDEYFVTPDEEDRLNVRFIIAALQRMPPDLLALEFGGGPALYSTVPLVPRAQEIHFSDYVPASLIEVQRWLDDAPNVFDWRPYIKMSLEEERLPTTTNDILQREAELRRKITRLLRGDARAAAPLGPRHKQQYDLVTAHHCTDVAAATADAWVQVIKNMTTLVKTGGWLMVSVTTGTTTYTVGHTPFPCVDLTQDDIRRGFLEAGYDPATLHLESAETPTGFEYSGHTMAVARRS